MRRSTLCEATRLDDQLVAHRPSRPTALQQLGFNSWGSPEGFYVYRTGAGGTDMEFAADLTLTKVRRAGVEHVLCTGVQFICPDCHGGLYINGDPAAGGRQITVHWNDIRRSDADGFSRPTFSVEGPFMCDYLWSEATGIVAPVGSRVRAPCGFRGVFERGRLYRHGIRIHAARAAVSATQ